jgi:hypothetical protein
VLLCRFGHLDKEKEKEKDRERNFSLIRKRTSLNTKGRKTF